MAMSSYQFQFIRHRTLCYSDMSELTVSNWLPGEPRYGSNCAVITNTNHGTGWKSVNCSERHTTLCKTGHI